MRIGDIPVKIYQKMGIIVNYKNRIFFNNMKSNIKIFKNSNQLASHIALEFKNVVLETIVNGKVLNVALSGGSTPITFFKKLAENEIEETIQWENVRFFWVDERCVPLDFPDSNFGITQDVLFKHIVIPSENIFRIHGEGIPETEVERYSKIVQNNLPKDQLGFPSFDWIFLGIGEDGHTGSLFPDMDSLKFTDKVCVVTTHPQSGQKRITLTLPVINSAKRITFLVTGKSKSNIVAVILSEKHKKFNYPAALVAPKSGLLEWLLDENAASFLR
jgi:6-phosphogluconolactonase